MRVGQRLVEAAHDAEADVIVALLHEGRNDGVKGALARRERVRVGGIEMKSPPRFCRRNP